VSEDVVALDQQTITTIVLGALTPAVEAPSAAGTDTIALVGADKDVR
jgi:hypothetical protein